MLFCGRFFLLSTTFLMLLFSLALSFEVEVIDCLESWYNTNYYDERVRIDGEQECVFGCSFYFCRVTDRISYGTMCSLSKWRSTEDTCNFVRDPYDYGPKLGKFVSRNRVPKDAPAPLHLYKKYMKEVKPFGRDSIQERLFWLEVTHEFDWPLKKEYFDFWGEKAKSLFSWSLQDMPEYQNVQKKVEEVNGKMDSLSPDFEDILKAANQQISPEYEYFQMKFAEKEAIKACARTWNETIQEDVKKLNDTLESETIHLDAALKVILNSMYDVKENVIPFLYECQEAFLEELSQRKEKVSTIAGFLNDGSDSFACLYDFKISYIQFVGHQARKAMENFEIEEEFKVLVHNVQMKNEEFNNAMDSLSRDSEDVQKAANQQSLPEYEYFQKKFAEMEAKMEAIKACARTWNETVHEGVRELNDTLEKRANRLKASMNVVKWNSEPSLSERQEIFLREFSESKEKASSLAKLLNESTHSFACLDDDEISYFQSAGLQARKAIKDFKNEKELEELIKEVKDGVEDIKKIGEAAQKTAATAEEIADQSKMLVMNAKTIAKNANETAEKSQMTATNAGNAANNANETAEESKIMAKEAQAVAEDANNIAKESSVIGKNAKNEFEHEMEALRSNGRKSGGYIGDALIATLIILLFV